MGENKELTEYFKNRLSQGATEDQIKKELTSVGWKEEDFRSTFPHKKEPGVMLKILVGLVFPAFIFFGSLYGLMYLLMGPIFHYIFGPAYGVVGLRTSVRFGLVAMPIIFFISVYITRNSAIKMSEIIGWKYRVLPIYVWAIGLLLVPIFFWLIISYFESIL